MSPTADPNDNYNIINIIAGNAMDKHIHLTNTRTNDLDG